MISTTNNTKEFFENSDGELLIYGADNAGYWLGQYLNRCVIAFSYFIDPFPIREGIINCNHPVFSPYKLSEKRDHSLRIVVSSFFYEKALEELNVLSEKYGFHAICLKPVYHSDINHGERYDINKLLSYFRHKLFVGQVPTIISNDCIAEELYNLMDMIPVSPTVNTSFSYEDFEKLYNNPEYYLKSTIRNLRWEMAMQSFVEQRDLLAIGAELEDIHIRFNHIQKADADTFSKYERRWRLFSERMNWNNLVFVLSANETSIPVSVLYSFSKLKYKHLIYFRGNGFLPKGVDDCLFTSCLAFYRGDDAIENHFDIVGWFNSLSSK